MHPLLIFLAAKAAEAGALGLFLQHRKEKTLREVERARREKGREQAIRDAVAGREARPIEEGEEDRPRSGPAAGG